MLLCVKKILQSIQTYRKYFYEALIEIYLYYSSPWPIHTLLKKMALANRKIRIIWTNHSVGRRPLDQDTINLILKLKKLNPTWGGQKISDELAKIGYRVCKRTVLKYLEIHGLNNPSLRMGPTWTEFINNHKFKIGIDFTSLISLMGHQLYIFVMIDLDRRNLISINVTYNPHFEWVKQQFKNAFFDLDHYPTLCICDNDQIFQGAFERMLKNYFGLKLRRTPCQSPDKNGRTERFHLSLKSEAFKDVIPINIRQAQRICSEYEDYYNAYRPHQGIHGKIPKKLDKLPKSRIDFFTKQHLNGKIVSFEPTSSIAA